MTAPPAILTAGARARMWDPKMVAAVCGSVKRDSVPGYDLSDFAQDVMVRLLTSRGYDPRRGNRQAYVRVVARSVLRDHIRREGRRSALLARYRSAFDAWMEGLE